MLPRLRRRCVASLLFVAAVMPGQAPVHDDLDDVARASAVDRIGRVLRERYVLREPGERAAQRLAERCADGAFREYRRPGEFAMAVTAALREFLHDGHLSVEFEPGAVGMEPAEPGPRERDARRRRLAAENFGFVRVERLGGNVGLLELHRLPPPSFAAPTAHAAMALLAHSDALIFDLRQNSGGDPGLVVLLLSYLFGERTHLNSLAWRDRAEPEQFWTLDELPGPRLPDVPVFVLTSDFTFSAAEEFAYDLQARGRAKTVGERTGGGAHPGGPVRADERFVVMCPQGRAVNPVTGTNWEGVGVVPDIAAPAATALTVAHLAALHELAERAAGPARRRELAWERDLVAARATPPAIDAAAHRRLVGRFGDREIFFDGESLFHRRGDGPRRRMIALGGARFALEGVHDVRLRFEPDDAEAARVVVDFLDGGRQVVPRD